MSIATTEMVTRDKFEDKEVSYIPLGEETKLELTVRQVRNFIGAKTRNGHQPSDEDCVKFIMLCKARQLNPWVGDAYLVGYDSNDGPKFTLITSQQALLKRAENCPEYDGMESGVVIEREGKIENRQGDMVLKGEKLIGGWAAVFRKDRGRPSSDTLSLETFNTNQSRWKVDPAGMIVKCAESSALRKAFPTQLGGLRTSTADAEPMQGGDEVIDSVPAIEHHADSVEPDRATEDADAPEVDMALNEYRSSFGGCRDITSVNKMEEVLIGESEIRFQGPALDLVKQSLKEQANARREEIRAARGSK